MYAVIRTGGKQYRVALGDIIRVERLPAATGETVNLDQILLIKDEKDVKVGTPMLSESVTATVKAHGRGEKINIFKMRRRKNSRRHAGHRQDYTELEVTGIGGVTQAAAKKAKTAKKAAPKAKPAADREGTDGT
jgi:large subunit ribosomal protein L21